MAELKVVAAVDGSSLSEASLRYLVPLKALGDLAVTLVGVVETYAEAEGLRGAQSHLERELKLMMAYLQRSASDLGPKLGTQVNVDLRTGMPDHQILQAALAVQADLLLITTHGRSGIGRWAIGSVADKVLRGLDRPALVIGPSASQRDPVPPFREILLPLDGSDLAEQAMPVALEWAKAFGARLHLVRAVPLPMMTSETMSVGPDLFDAMRDAAQAYITRINDQLGGTAVTDVPIGLVADQLTEYVATKAIDLVVMTSHGRGGLLRSVLGSVTDRMLHGPAPVLVVRAH